MRPEKWMPPNEGTCQTVEILNNGLVKIQRRGHRESISITRIAPFFAKEQQE